MSTDEKRLNIFNKRLICGDLEQYLNKPINQRISNEDLAKNIDLLLREEDEFNDKTKPITNVHRTLFLEDYMGVLSSAGINENQIPSDVQWHSTANTFLDGNWMNMTHKYDRRRRAGLE